MKRLISISLFLCLLLSVQAQKVYTTDNIPKVHLQNKMRYVCNPDGILSQAACDSIDRMLYALEQQTGIETVVAVVPSIGNDDCFDFAHRLLNEWGVGKKGKNNGLVILLVTDQRCIQFYTGYGLEGDLPDAICKRIQTRDMIPYLKDGNWDAGMVAGVRAVCGRLDGSMVNDTDDEEDISFFGILAAVIGFFIVAGGIGWMAARAASKCPNCGQHKLQRTSSKVVSRINGVKTEDVTYTCRNCGHKVVRRKQSYDENYRGGGGGGPVIFGGGGGFGGGGFGGGGAAQRSLVAAGSTDQRTADQRRREGRHGAHQRKGQAEQSGRCQNGVDAGLGRRNEERDRGGLRGPLAVHGHGRGDHPARTQRQRHAEQGGQRHRAEVVAGQITGIEPPGHEGMQQPGNQEAEQQIRRHFVEQRHERHEILLHENR